jgi:hypothetical protein
MNGQLILESVTNAIGLIATVKIFLDETGLIDCFVEIKDDVKKTSPQNASDESEP